MLADGPLPLLAFSALEGVPQGTAYATAGGVWTKAAEEAVRRLLATHPIETVVLAFAGNEHGRRPRELAAACLADAAPGLTVDKCFPRGRDWLADLRAARLGMEA